MHVLFLSISCFSEQQWSRQRWSWICALRGSRQLQSRAEPTVAKFFLVKKPTILSLKHNWTSFSCNFFIAIFIAMTTSHATSKWNAHIHSQTANQIKIWWHPAYTLCNTTCLTKIRVEQKILNWSAAVNENPTPSFQTHTPPAEPVSNNATQFLCEVVNVVESLLTKISRSFSCSHVNCHQAPSTRRPQVSAKQYNTAKCYMTWYLCAIVAWLSYD